MVVDDSAVIRGLITRWIDSEIDIKVAASIRTGLDAVNQVDRVDPDVVVLDIEMPDMDGISALPLLLKKKPKLVVIMASTLTRRNAEISFKALSLGASDYIPKPESTREIGAADTFKRDLIEKIRHLGARARRPVTIASPSIAPAAPAASAPLPKTSLGNMPRVAQPKLMLRPFGAAAPRALLIGSSTGGPQALMTLVAGIKPVIEKFPVLITQHMPPTFTTILAEHLARSSGSPVHEGVDGEPVKPGQIYLAPGGHHMRVVRAGTGAAIALGDDAQINFCKPAVDPMFKSAIDVWQGGIMAVVLTGMGSDGMRAGKEVVAAGGSLIAQDEATSVVWGMPGSAANAGICAAVLPLDQIGPKLVRLFSGVRS
ncbi:MAG: chemotaxis response regulator protein-glutamate methylesterase [Afipia sp.]|nr:chemotaxis response regulator protein-glutamate methylesterase [Afipia sp.]